MEQAINDIRDVQNRYYHDLAMQQLMVLKNVGNRQKSNFIQAVGQERLKQYIDNNIALDRIYNYFRGFLSDKEAISTKGFILGYEFNICLLEELKRIGMENIQSEVPITDTVLDALGYSNGNQKLVTILSDMTQRKLHLRQGYHSFEAKAHADFKYNVYKKNNKIFGPKVIKQIKGAVGHYKDSETFTKAHVYVLENAIIDKRLNDEINELGADIVRSNVSVEGINNRIRILRDTVNLSARGSINKIKQKAF